jgi:hypothetical protein
VVTVGSSRVGGDLLRRVVDAYEPARAQIPGFRMLVVTGPRIEPHVLKAPPGVELEGSCPTCICGWRPPTSPSSRGPDNGKELAAARVPFVYFPLRLHCEQNFHVRHRLERYQAGRAMDFDASPPDEIAAATAAELNRGSRALPVDAGGASLTAALIAELL